ncbi:hypothetical protein EMCG_00422 [[Emmonsia] crescens]|uniref:Uncharacterized protein n=1 Tax=[Emmonsia] crescens TaxID=73230 RepID=A0A0G2HWU2_9EURO|nr:hypothetical protein EMCG_00422 [Emmonsia crescens UAMH 3008]
MPYSYDDLSAALDLIREERPKITTDGLFCRFLEDYIKYDLRYKDPLKCPSTWVDDDPSGDFELYNDRQTKRTRRPSKRKPSGPPSAASEPPAAKMKTSDNTIPSQPPFIQDPSIVNLKFKLPASKCFLAVLAKTGGKSVSSIANIGSATSKKASHKTLPEIPCLSASVGSSSTGGESGINCDSIIYPQPQTPPSAKQQDENTFVTLPGQEVQYYHYTPAAPFSKMVEDAILQSNIRASVEPPAEQHGSWEDHIPLPPLENSAISQMATPLEDMLLQELLKKTYAETDSLFLVEAASAISNSTTTRTSARSTTISPKQAPPDYNTIVPNVSCVKFRKRRTAGPITKKIRTSFAHPITFTHSPGPNDSRPCHWCHDFIYGMLGLGQIEVEVLDRRDGRGYTEISTGHVSSGYEPSRMCSKCALHRVAILECNNTTTTTPATHSVVPIAGIDETSFDMATAFNSLFAADGDGNSNWCGSANPWCSICVNPAFYRCAGKPAQGSIIENMMEMDIGMGIGDALPRSCGLLLCGRCAALMRQFKGRLGQTIEKRRGEGIEMRADIEFLSTTNELYQTYERKIMGFW